MLVRAFLTHGLTLRKAGIERYQNCLCDRLPPRSVASRSQKPYRRIEKIVCDIEGLASVLAFCMRFMAIHAMCASRRGNGNNGRRPERTDLQLTTAITPGSNERHDVRRMLRESGLRPTRQRVALAEILFSKGNRHVSAEVLHEEAEAAQVPVSLATVYNTLHQFTEAGLLREVAVEGTKTYFDTNTDEHHHFFIEGENRVVDIPGEGVSLAALPPAPEGMEIVRVEVVVRVRRKR